MTKKLNRKKADEVPEPPELIYREPLLRITPYAWSKAIHFLKEADTETSMMGISAKDDLLLVVDVALIEQECSGTSTEFDGDAYNNYIYDAVIEKKEDIERVGRIWIHTHPGFGASPSGTDKGTMKEVFGNCDFAVRLILGEISKTNKVDYSCMLQVKRFGLQIPMEVDIDYGTSFAASERDKWDEELKDKVSKVTYLAWQGGTGYLDTGAGFHNAEDDKKTTTTLKENQDWLDVLSDAYDVIDANNDDNLCTAIIVSDHTGLDAFLKEVDGYTELSRKERKLLRHEIFKVYDIAGDV